MIEILVNQNWWKINLRIQETQQTPRKINKKKIISKVITGKLKKTKNKENILKEARWKWHIIYTGTMIGINIDFLSEIRDQKMTEHL